MSYKNPHTSIACSLAIQTNQGRPRSALFTDIDNTFYYASHQPAVEAAWQLKKQATDAPYPIVGITGAHFNTIMRRIQAKELPQLDIVASSVGTEIWQLQTTGEYVQDVDYDHIMSSTGYNIKAIKASCIEMIDRLQRRGINIQLQDKIEPYKVSLYFFGAKFIKEITQLFQQCFSELKVVVCEEVHYNTDLRPGQSKKYCLDILPATKATAMHYLIKRFDLERGVVAGDSGNDIDLLTSAPESFIAVAVGGHKPELQAALQSSNYCWIDTAHHRYGAQSLLLFNDYLCGEELSDTPIVAKNESTDC